MTDHTPEHLRHSGGGVIVVSGPMPIRITRILDDEHDIVDREKLAERMTAAYNACAGVPTERLPNVAELLTCGCDVTAAWDAGPSAKFGRVIGPAIVKRLRAALAPFRED